MIDAGLVEALNHSIDRLNVGESAAACLLRYPQYAAELAPLLEVGQVVRRAQADAGEAVRARERQRERFERALNQPPALQPPYALRSLGRLVATSLLILTVLGGGAGLLAEGSLPGDLLYGVKLWTESIRVTLADYDADVQAAFALRRIDEARQLIQLRRSAEMTISGVVQSVGDDGLWIDGLLVRAEDSQITAGSRVEVDVRSTDEGALIAIQIRQVDPPSTAPALIPDPTAMRQLTEDPLFADAAAPLITETPLPDGEPTATDSRTPEPTPLESPSDSRVSCNTQPPVGWVRHLIQRGDTLSALAVASGGSIEEIMAANCLEDARSIIAGQFIFLPRAEVRTGTRPLATDSPTATAVPPIDVDRPEPTRPPDR